MYQLSQTASIWPCAGHGNGLRWSWSTISPSTHCAAYVCDAVPSVELLFGYKCALSLGPDGDEFSACIFYPRHDNVNSIDAHRKVERWLEAFVQDYAAGQPRSCIKITPPQGERPTKAEVAASVTMTLGRSVTEDDGDDSKYIIIQQHRFPKSYLRLLVHKAEERKAKRDREALTGPQADDWAQGVEKDLDKVLKKS
ncbi:hypothetical protein NM208_g11688 [Fusarium decemcellulare]|uniref:Uncharacterized protein n=1 Tax=Fusarium decemcellulare TaxID=57161 RepID=A0ACC1RSU4_9HYPO|nr:hypothetical protein NM208_g11688 [Fusarium decemcellulare]